MRETLRAKLRDIPRIWLALALSLLLHVTMLWKLPQVDFSRPPELPERGGPLIVQLTPPPAPAIQRRREAPALPRSAPPAPRKTIERPRPAPPVIVGKDIGPAVPARPPQPPVAVPAPSPPAPPGDFAAYVEARRRARGEVAQVSPIPEAPAAPTAAEDENARANRIAAANLGLDRKPTFGADWRKGGGIFQITRMGFDYAEFAFYGWNKDIRRETAQVIDVRKGNHPDIRLAVVRRMIAIIREHEQGDFVWESHRLDRNVTLSARPRDNAGLEEFLMREFFEDPRRPAAR